MKLKRRQRVLAILKHEHPYKLTARQKWNLREIGNVVPNGRNRRVIDRFVAACVVLPLTLDGREAR